MSEERSSAGNTLSESFLAPRMSRFKPSPSQIASARVRDLIAEGRDIIKLTAGEPDFPAPAEAQAAVVALMRDNGVVYTPINGTLELRKAIQHKFRRDNDLDYALDEIAVGSGTKQVIFNALMATVHGGDEVIVLAPYWASYPDMVKLAGGTPVIIDCPAEHGFKVTPQALDAAITARTKWVMFNSPNNPTGALYSRAELAALCEVLLAHPHVHVLADDVYEHLRFDGRDYATFAQVEPRLKSRTLTCNGVSKGYSMTGFRCGFAGGPKALISNVSKMQSQSTAGANALGMAAAAAVLTLPLDEVRARTTNLQRRRDMLFDALSQVELLTCARPEGAMYLYMSCAGAIGKRGPDGRVIDNDTDFVMYLLDTVGVAVVQGEAYGLSPYFRASFVAPETDLLRGAELIRQACAALE
ncbi:MAG: aminotransferase class I/II-fold pyridoxal phosphate-dependent enzyme [Gammaproteobacteria bacterium]|nr:aminotransferase class I/II-fold pyridoxal phosphate-dependent enzyme [Gammaproteobacteria bacterium]